jgi:hypothetical protein
VSEKALQVGNEPGGLSTTEALSRAQAGDTAALSALRQQMDSSWWDEVTDLARNAEQSLVHAVAGNNALLDGAVSQKLAVLKAELGGPSPNPLERLLVERVATCWLQVHLYGTVYAQNLHRLSLAEGEYQQQRLDHAHRRYLSAIRSLAVVRRLLQPAVAQVNIGAQQINVSR